jgi:hypothetical protein
VGIDPSYSNNYIKIPVIKTDENVSSSLIERFFSSSETIIIVPRSFLRGFSKLRLKCLKILYFSPTPFDIFKALGKRINGGCEHFKDILTGLGGLIYYYFKAF